MSAPTNRPQFHLRFSNEKAYTFESIDIVDYPFRHADRVKQIGYLKVYQAFMGVGRDVPRTQVLLKFAKTHEDIQSLIKEAGIYQTELRSLQGKVVPRYYGTYSARIDGVEQAIMILEYCSNVGREGMRVPAAVDDDFPRRVMVAACKIHQAGLVHGNLRQHHILPFGNDVRIVDFSSAQREHRCNMGVPTLANDRSPLEGCKD